MIYNLLFTLARQPLRDGGSRCQGEMIDLPVIRQLGNQDQ
jgi:hypothetical protein